MNILALRNEIVFFPRTAFIQCNVLVLLAPSAPYFLLRVESLNLYGNAAGVQVAHLNNSQTNPKV